MDDKQQPSTMSSSKQLKGHKLLCQCGEKAKYYCDEVVCKMHGECIYICDPCLIKIMEGVSEKHLMFPLTRFQIIYDTTWLPICKKEEQIRIVANHPKKQVFAYFDKQEDFTGRRVSKDLEILLSKDRQDISKFAQEYEECMQSGQFDKLRDLNKKLTELSKRIEADSKLFEEINKPDLFQQNYRQTLKKCSLLTILQESLSLAESVIELKESLAMSIIEEAKHLDALSKLKAKVSAYSTLFGGLKGASQIFKVLINNQKQIQELLQRIEALENPSTKEGGSSNSRLSQGPRNEDDLGAYRGVLSNMDSLNDSKSQKECMEAFQDQNEDYQQIAKNEESLNSSGLQNDLLMLGCKQLSDAHLFTQARLDTLKIKIQEQIKGKFSEKYQQKWNEYANSQEWRKTIYELNTKADINRPLNQTELEVIKREDGRPQLLPGEYYGQMLNGKRDGYGIVLCIDDQKRAHFYACEWKDGYPIKDGRHVMTDSQWRKFEGTFDAQLFLTGKGKMIAEEGEEYEGEWKQGKFHGPGTLKKSTGWSFTGYWKEDKMHGSGIETEASGEYCEGVWNENLKVGEHRYYSKDKVLIKTEMN
ncbi:hypothetical protein FGO68_gene265 [Halteria grandinella]|uniref:MORN repeat protein n=1 Tax=Halteria grandinella TaxID=5974 RepID=A0A8J8NTP5_HALGN|nr:hypothetical protein FGO68_gene265 [Halteria grandinella]